MCSSASLNFSLELSLSLRKMNSLFSHVLWPHPASCYHDEKNSHLVFTSFYSLTLVYFLSVSSCAKLRLPAETSPRLCKTSQRPLPRLLNSKPISDFGKTLSWKDGEQRESFKHKSYASTNPRLCCAWCNIENRILASLKKSMRVLNMWLMIVQVYAIAPIAVNVGYPKFSFS